MSIVAISQTLGSLGDEIGRELARILGWEFADREIIAQAAQRFGEGVLELEHATEEKPSLWDRFTDTKRRYLTYVEAMIFDMAARDNVILSGRGATIFLRKVRHALRVRISAPERVRAYRVEHQQELTSDAAIHRVRQNDRERASNVKFLYHVDWDDPLLYDLVLNTERMDVKEGARLIQNALQNERAQPTPESRAEVKDLSLAAQAKAALLAHPELLSVLPQVDVDPAVVAVALLILEQAQLIRVAPRPAARVAAVHRHALHLDGAHHCAAARTLHESLPPSPVRATHRRTSSPTPS